MREILFRGKTKHGGEWVYGGVCCSAGNTIIVSFSERILTTIEGKRVLPETVGQYTGLTDKNGKKIFEGDILSVTVNEVKQAYVFDEQMRDLVEMGIYTEDEVGKVKVTTRNKTKAFWTVDHKDHFSQGIGFYLYGKNRRFHLKLSRSTLLNVGAEVIGNIHDNPELLKGE